MIEPFSIAATGRPVSMMGSHRAAVSWSGGKDSCLALILRDIDMQALRDWLDHDLLARLPPGICPGGKDGKFHTFVWDARPFRRPLRLSTGMQVRIASQPPLAPTELVLRIPELAEAEA